ncbi:unnamed protein product [Strongylus vulgaris]|uniref:Endonuclease/exonuclease/phosphatase domain-containing protein n=1 Tax=Strongylus vulgaris TaxID=40348 RepID=A0A3P7IYA2_STRVU|nr:unnamed protein product [Strongylus vulgaris]
MRLYTLDHIYGVGCHKTSVKLHRTPWILGQKDTSMTRHGDCLMLCTYNVRTVSSNAGLHALLKAARCINYHVIALQETRSRKTEQLSDGTLPRNRPAGNKVQEDGHSLDREDETLISYLNCDVRRDMSPREAKRPRERPPTRSADVFITRMEAEFSAANE